jgi:hypothetical protein
MLVQSYLLRPLLYRELVRLETRSEQALLDVLIIQWCWSCFFESTLLPFLRN